MVATDSIAPEIRRFLIHSWMGTALFIGLAVPAGVINVVLRQCEPYVDIVIRDGLLCGEYLLFFTDVVLFFICIVRAAVHLGQHLLAKSA